MIELRTLGEICVLDEGRRVRLATRKQSALLVYLAVHVGRVLRRDQLATLLWEHAPISRARHSLSQTIYDLRKRLRGLDICLTTDEAWLENGTVVVDALEFDAMIDHSKYAPAVVLYSGPFLDGFWIPNAPTWEDWQEAKRTEYDRKASNALRRLMAEAEANGDWQQAESCSSRLLNFDPYDEAVHRVRIRAIAAGGEPDRAMLELATLQDTFDRELGRPLNHETVALRDQIAAMRNVVIGTADPTIPDESPVSFVGRHQEFLLIQREWNIVRSGNTRIVAIFGEAGIGKTRLCHRALRWTVLHGARTLHGRCYSPERQIPYSGMVDVLVNNVNTDDIAKLSPTWSSAIGDLLPEFARDQDKIAIQSLNREGARRRLFESIAQLFINMAEQRPLVVFIDDFHWADDSTLAMTHYLARRLSKQPVLLIVAIRTEDINAGSTLEELISSLQTTDRVRSVTLRELDIPHVTQLIDSYELQTGTSVPGNTREAIQAMVGGRPFLIIEMLNAWRQSVLNIDIQDNSPRNALRPTFLPSTLEEFLTGRCRNLGDAATAIVHSLAVLGRTATPELVQALSGLTPAALLLGVGELTRKKIVADRGPDIAFAHDLLREATYRSLDTLQRQFLHERAATILNAASNIAAGTIAVHYHRAGNRLMAFQYAMEAARAHEQLFAQQETEFFLQLALTNATTPDQTLLVQESLAKFFYRSIRYVEAKPYFDSLIEHYKSTGNVQGLIIAQVNWAAVHIEQNTRPSTEIVARLHEIAETAEQLGDQEVLSDILRRLAIIAHYIGDRDLALAVVSKLLVIADTIGSNRHGILARAMAAAIVGIYRSATEGLNYAETAVRQAEAAGDPILMSSALRARAKNMLQIGLLDAAERDIAEASRLAMDNGFLEGAQDARIALAFLLAERGDFEGSEATLAEVMKVAEDTQSTREWSSAAANLLLVYFEQGRLEDAKSTANQILSLSDDQFGLWPDVTALSILGLCALTRNDWSQAGTYRNEVVNRYISRKSAGFEGADVSYIEMFLTRYAALEGDTDAALVRLTRAIDAYKDRDVFCRSRLQLERARLLMDRDARTAWLEAGEVRIRGLELRARPLVTKADAILDRLPGPGV